MNDQEVWKAIENFEGLYEVSSFGRVKRVERVVEVKSKNQHSEYVTKRTFKECLIKPVLYDGYYCVSLYKNRKMYLKKIHRLVAIAFLGKSDLTVNHKNGIKTDNRIENLEFITAQENTAHAIRTGLRPHYNGQNNPNSKLTEKDVLDIRFRKVNNELKNTVYTDYLDKISKSQFEQIWYNCSWKHIVV